MRFGANYTPRRRWFHAWLDFDPAEVAEDLGQIAALGLDHVRVFPLWPILQPNRGVVRPAALDQVRRLVDVAADCGLDVLVDGLQGHLSGFEFYPSWTQTRHARNIFTEPKAVAAQATLMEALGAALADRPNLLGVQLGNELNNLVANNPVSVEEVDHYLDTLLAGARAGVPAGLVTHSAFNAALYVDDHPFTPEASARKGDLTTVHPWVFTNGCATTYGPLSVESTHLAEYEVELAKAYAERAGRQVWVQEVGAPEPQIPAADAPAFVRATMRNAADCADVYGITWWCSHDIDPALVDYKPLEYTLGLIDVDGRVKPTGHAVAEMVAELRAEPPRPEPRTTALVLDCDLATRSTSGPGGAYFEAWMRLRAGGLRPAVVLAARAGDPAYLASRDIAQLTYLRA
jgi:hypothetical protein